MPKDKLSSYHVTLKKRIQQLRNIRNSIFEPADQDSTFANEQSSPTKRATTSSNSNKPVKGNSIAKSDSESPKSSINRVKKPINHEESQRTQNQNQNYIYRKLQTTVKLLNESLEEQGNLRALLELTSHPLVYNSILQSEIFHLTQQAESLESFDPDLLDDNLSISNDLLSNVKHRALFLEQQQLASEVGRHYIHLCFCNLTYIMIDD